METVRSFLSQISLPVLVSAVTSAVVSLASFLVGSRFAKERSDRGTLRQLYQDLRQHMVELREAIERGRPKRWEDYPTSHNRYMPPIATMEHSGRLALVPERLSKRLLALEKEALSAEWSYRKWLESVITKITSLFNERVRSPTSSISGRSYSNPNIGWLALHGSVELDEAIERVETEDLGWGLDVSLDKNRYHTLYAFKETVVEGTLAGLMRSVTDAIDSDAAGQEPRSKLEALEQDLDDVIRKLTRRVSEPQPFWETIGRAFLDLWSR